jgi:hypothetical protein
MTLMEVSILVITVSLAVLAILALVLFFFVAKIVLSARRAARLVKAEWIVSRLLLLSFLRPVARRLNRLKNKI